MKKRILVVAATFYDDIAQALIDGAVTALERAGARVDRADVPGALEIPSAILLADNGRNPYDGYVALGCVIRGETTHYDYVCGESARALMDLGLAGIPVGNGILTVEDREQAHRRAVDKDKGADAANACLALLELRDRFGSRT